MKLSFGGIQIPLFSGITRQKCRVRIETSIGGRFAHKIRGITRQKCRVRIETNVLRKGYGSGIASPGRNAGCGLKRCDLDHREQRVLGHHPAEMPGAD